MARLRWRCIFCNRLHQKQGTFFRRHRMRRPYGRSHDDIIPIGQCLYDNLQNATMHYPYAEIPLFVVMPNHWHAIIFIDGDKTPYQRRHTVDHTGNIDHTGIANMQGWLSIVIGGIKSAVTKFANENGIEFVWQTRFDDKIIRNQEAMNKIADYIENNVAHWAMDCFNNVKKN